jgi:hypothetical protein
LQQELPIPLKPSELNLGAPKIVLNPDIEFHTLEGIEEYVLMQAKSQGFKLHLTRHKKVLVNIIEGKLIATTKNKSPKEK